MVHRAPTKEEIETLPVLDVTDSFTEWRPTTLPTNKKHEQQAQQEFNVEIAEIFIQDRQSKGRGMQYITQPLRAANNWPAKKIQTWSEILGYVPNEVVKYTLLNTTQAVMMDTDEPNHSTMKRRMKGDSPSSTANI